MDAPALAAKLLPWVWVVWAITCGATAVTVWRREILPHRARRRGAAIVVAVAVALLALAHSLPGRVDASGLMELVSHDDRWKGIVGEALLRILEIPGPLGPADAIAVTRLFLLPAALLAPAVVVAVSRRNEGLADWERAGVDLSLALLSSALLLTPSFAFGITGVFNFWFFGMVMLGAMLALEQLEASPGWTVRIALACSLVLLGLSRPETIAGGLVATAVVLGSVYRREDVRGTAAAATALAVLMIMAPSMVQYLGQDVRHQPLTMGEDTAGGASVLDIGWILLSRAVQHVPRDLWELLGTHHLFLAVALVYVARLVRKRGGTAVEWAAIGWLGAELVAVAVHQEGFARRVKYGQLVAVPVWFLFLSALSTGALGNKSRLWVAGAAVAASLVLAMYGTRSLRGEGRCASPAGRSRAGQLADASLLWTTVPGWTESLCEPGDGETRVAVVLFDEKAGASITTPHPSEAGACESERWPVSRWLDFHGCGQTVSFARGRGVEQALCGDPQHLGGPAPTHAIVTFYRPSRRREIRRALRRPDCGWKRLDEEPGATLLERSGAP